MGWKSNDVHVTIFLCAFSNNKRTVIEYVVVILLIIQEQNKKNAKLNDEHVIVYFP